MKLTDKKELQVSAIKNGTVIDHIPSHKLFKVISILGLKHIDSNITIGNNYPSGKLGKKGIIKIADKYFRDDELNTIALVVPNVKLNVIENYEVVKKSEVSVPQRVIGLVKCINPKCITNHDDITTKFDVVDREKIDLKCIYCEKITDYNNIEVKK